MNIVYTIGHSTLTIEKFLSELKSNKIKNLIDIRRFPGSRKYPQFNQESLKVAVEEAGINYVHLVDLGGRRKVRKDSINNSWRNDSFKGYADYMQTEEFEIAISKLEKIALSETTVYMCAEAVWWRCQRSMVSDYLKAKGWKVLHIMPTGKSQEHTYTEPAKVIGNKISYANEN